MVDADFSYILGFNGFCTDFEMRTTLKVNACQLSRKIKLLLKLLNSIVFKNKYVYHYYIIGTDSLYTSILYRGFGLLSLTFFNHYIQFIYI